MDSNDTPLLFFLVTKVTNLSKAFGAVPKNDTPRSPILAFLRRPRRQLSSPRNIELSFVAISYIIIMLAVYWPPSKTIVMFAPHCDVLR